MALIRCSKCGKEISTRSKNCVYCGEVVKVDKNTKVIVQDEETENNIHNLRIISIITSLMFIILGIVIIGYGVDVDNDVTVLLVVIGISVIIGGLILAVFINWMALILKNIYDINKKV